MTIFNVLMVSIGGIRPPENLIDALRIDTGETRMVREVYFHEAASLEDADAYIAALPQGHTSTQTPKAITVDEIITGYRLRLNQEVEALVVTGGWSLIGAMSIGQVDFYRVTADAVHLEALHNWMAANVHAQAGAIAVENNAQPHTMKASPVRDLLYGGVWEWDTRLAAMADFFDSPDVSHILAAGNDAELFEAILRDHPATPDALRDDELMRRFWKLW